MKWNTCSRLLLLSTTLLSVSSLPVSAGVDLDKLFSMSLEQLMDVTVETANKSTQKAIDVAQLLRLLPSRIYKILVRIVY